MSNSFYLVKVNDIFFAYPMWVGDKFISPAEAREIWVRVYSETRTPVEVFDAPNADAAVQPFSTEWGVRYRMQPDGSFIRYGGGR